MKENARVLLRMLTEFNRQVQDSLGERGKPALLLGNPVVRMFNAYLEQMREMFPDSFIAQLPSVEAAPELGETELAPDELEKLHLSKAHEVSMACSQIIEYLTGRLNGEAGFPKATRGLPEILAVLDALREETQELQLADSEEDKRITEMLVGKYNDCLSVCREAVGESDAILPRLFKPIEFAGDKLSYAAKIQEVKISASGLHAYLESVGQQEEALKKQQRASTREFAVELSHIRDWMDTKERHIRRELEDVRQQAEETKDQVFEKIDERIENVEVQFEERIQQLERRLDEVNENIDELKDRFNEMIDERTNELGDGIGNLEEELNNRIEELAGELNNRIGELEEEHDDRINKIDENLNESIGEINDGLDERFDGLNERLDELAKNLDEKANELSEEREESVNELEEKMEELREEIDQRIEELREKIDE